MKNILMTLVALLLSINLVAQEGVLSRNSSLRSGPSSSSKLVTSLRAGTAVTVVSKYPRSGYVKVKTTDQTGWVLKRNLVAAAAERVPRRLGSRAGDDQIYPNSVLTPGKQDPRVSQENIAENICNKEWSTDMVRPSTSVTNRIKRETMQAYRFTDAANHYELDHLISLQNGGCPDCVENLFPQAYGDRDHAMTQNERAKWNRENPGSTEVLPGALEKDLVENHIHDQ